MKNIPLTKYILIAATSFLLVYGCNETSLKEIESPDEDMLVATEMAESYLNSTGARGGYQLAITILKYKDGKLYFHTNTNGYPGFQEITEESITAEVGPGEFVFWFAGSGLASLNGIEFDQQSQSQLYELPEETNADRMWMINVPITSDMADGTLLKYDILYKIKGGDGSLIRLDPKVKVDQ